VISFPISDFRALHPQGSPPRSITASLPGSVTALSRGRPLSGSLAHSRSLSVTGLSTTASGPHSFLG
jgi:hypothetical protein